MSTERVLVFPADAVSLAEVRGFCAECEPVLEAIFAPGVLRPMPRDLAEEDPRYKQLVSYAVLVAGGDVFAYRRGSRGGESRLHAKRSIGVGGHIAAEDTADRDADRPVSDGRTAYRRGYERELAEEVAIDEPLAARIIGLVHDDSTPVGRVHVGVVHLVELPRPLARPLDPSLAEADFFPLADLSTDLESFESWSRYALEGLIKGGKGSLASRVA